MGTEFLRRMNETYAKKKTPRDAFGRRPATGEDFGRQPATPKQIQDTITQTDNFEDLLDQYPPTDEDVGEKGGGNN